jgi:uncharacterized protein YdcH (DUF465 family)
MDGAQLPQEQLKARLLQRDEDFRALVSEHQTLDEHVRRLSTLSYLTPEQQVEEAALKKRKLALKDRIEAALRAVSAVEGTA